MIDNPLVPGSFGTPEWLRTQMIDTLGADAILVSAIPDDELPAYYESLFEEEEEEPEPDDWNDDDGLTDAEADAMTLAGAGWGSDEDYGYYGENEY